MMKDFLDAELGSIKDEGLYRQLRVVSSAPEARMVIEGREYLNFSSNNYLGLANHPEVKAAAAAAVARYGCGGTSSRLIAGTLEVHHELEERLAAFKGAEAALVFPSGFQTNTGVIGSLLGAGDCLIMDRLNHASLWDAAKLCGARVFVYPHGDMNGLEKVLKRAHAYRHKLIATDSVFSMDGDCAPLGDIATLAGRYGAWTMVDEAHGTGILGEHGRGLAEQCDVEDRIDIRMGTLSKALGSQGGFVCGSRQLVDYLINRCRSFIYTTAVTPAAAAAATAALKIVEREPERRRRLLTLSARLRDKLAAIGFTLPPSSTQIVPLLVGPVTETVSLAAHLWRNGIFAPAIRPPTVPAGQCRLRFSLTADHAESDVAALVSALIE